MWPSFTTATAHPGELVVFQSAKTRSTLSVSSCCAKELAVASKHSTSIVSATRLIISVSLETVTQRELHHARSGQRRGVEAEARTVRQAQVSRSVASRDGLQGRRIEAH